MRLIMKNNTPTIRVLRLIETFYPNVTGPVNQAYNISSELEKRTINSPIITTFHAVNKSEVNNLEHYKGVAVRRYDSWFSFLQYIITPRMISEFGSKFGNYDVIHAHNYRSFQTYLGFVMAKIKRKPFVLNTHGGLLGYNNYLKNWFVKLPYRIYDALTLKSTAKRADAIIVSSYHEKKEALMYGVDEKKIYVIPMGITIDDYTFDRTKRKNNTLQLLFVGRISRNRNIEPIIHAIALLPHQNVHLRIVGEEIKNSATDKKGYLVEMKKLAEKLGIKEKITFAGAKYGKDLIEEYKHADVFVYTSLSENFGQTILEAAASGLALICTKVGIVNDIVKDAENGFVVNSDPQQIADRILRLTIRSKRLEFGKKIQNIVKKEYDWKKIIDKYVGVYKELLNMKK